MPRVLAVDWDSEQVRFVLGNVAGDSVTILRAGSAILPSARRGSGTDTAVVRGEDRSLTLGGGDEQVPPPAPNRNLMAEVGATLKTLLREEHVGKAELLLAVPRASVEVLYLSLPNVPENDLPDIVQNQILHESTTYLEGQPLDFLPLTELSTDKTLRVMSVSMTRIQLDEITTAMKAASRKPKSLEFRPLALTEILRAGLIPLPKEEGNFDGTPVLLFQEVSDEVNLAVYSAKGPAYLRAFKKLSGVTGNELIERLAAEMTRTLATWSESEEAGTIHRLVVFGSEADVPFYTRLEKRLVSCGLEPVLYNPFDLPGIYCPGPIPEDVSRFAPLIGVLLAARKSSKPILDLLHPRQKPKPPNYLAISLAILACLGLVFGILAWYNMKSLEERRQGLRQLESERDALITQIRQVSPAWQVLSRARVWETGQGVNMLDELRDITLRIPQAPDLTITRLAWSHSIRNRPAFIVSGKVTSLAVYQQFYFSLTSDKSHTIVTAGPKVLPSEGGFTHEFTAQIFCHARSWPELNSYLPSDLQKITGQYPEEWSTWSRPANSPQMTDPAHDPASAPSTPSAPSTTPAPSQPNAAPDASSPKEVTP